MDLFGRKSQAKLEIMLYWLAEKEQRLQSQDLTIQSQDRIVEKLREHIFRLEAQLYARPQSSQVLPPVRDEEVEARFALRNGDIDHTEFENLLQAAGFDNTEVEFPTRPERPIVY